MRAWAVVIAAVVIGCGSSSVSTNLGGACDAGSQCGDELVCTGGECAPTCTGLDAGCSSGRYCYYSDFTEAHYACVPQRETGDSCLANSWCQSLNCADGGTGSVCDPDAG